ncbi:hypothetical protein BH10PSE16_BH10PSE16_01100 [soil metagenome]
MSSVIHYRHQPTAMKARQPRQLSRAELLKLLDKPRNWSINTLSESGQVKTQRLQKASI